MDELWVAATESWSNCLRFNFLLMHSMTLMIPLRHGASLSLSLKMPSLFRQVSWVIQIPFLCTVLFMLCVCSLLCSVDACWWVHLLPVLITASLVMETQCVGQKYLTLTYTHCQELINSAGNVMLGGQYHTCCCWRFSKMHMTTVSKSSSILFHGLVFSFL